MNFSAPGKNPRKTPACSYCKGAGSVIWRKDFLAGGDDLGTQKAGLLIAAAPASSALDRAGG